MLTAPGNGGKGYEEIFSFSQLLSSSSLDEDRVVVFLLWVSKNVWNLGRASARCRLSPSSEEATGLLPWKIPREVL